MSKIIPLKGGDEYDALTGWKNFLHWKPGERKLVKRKYNKRLRQILKKQIESEESLWT